MTKEVLTEEKIVRKRIDADQFVVAWIDAVNGGGTQADVAAVLDCSPQTVSNNYKRLVDSGAILPELPTGNSKKKTVDISAINKYVKANLKKS